MKSLEASLLAQKSPIAVVGLGYVGLPLACLLADKFKVIGFDINAQRVDELKAGTDRTNEVTDRKKLVNSNLTYTSDPEILGTSSFVIVAVPTPVDNHNVPDLSPVISASVSVGKHIKRGTIVVFESTVYPGLTESVCRKHIEEQSGLTFNDGFFLGYSPERVVPGDKQRTIEKIKKIVSGSTPEVTNLLAKIYGSIIEAGIHKAPSIAVAEAAKVIENTQRDLNIALVNELSMLFDRIGIDTLDVLEAAGTKWNFLPFRPGLVGGHCIGVDPYYLTFLADSVGFQTQVISAGRRINNHMGEFVAKKTVGSILAAKKPPSGSLHVAIMGVTFKENVPDIRNSKVADLAKAFADFGVKVHIVDPMADPEEVRHEYGLELTTWDELPVCDAIVLAVTHDIFRQQLPLDQIAAKLTTNRILVDLKGFFSREEAAAKGFDIWRL